jgi:hypothetical protein
MKIYPTKAQSRKPADGPLWLVGSCSLQLTGGRGGGGGRGYLLLLPRVLPTPMPPGLAASFSSPLLALS